MFWIPLAVEGAKQAGAIMNPANNRAASGPGAMFPGGDFTWAVDHSGWTVATGSASASATTGAALSDVSRMMPWVALAVVGIVAFKAWGKK